MREQPCIPFPLDWARNVDFVPLLSLQAKLNEKQNLFHFQGRVSTGKSKPIKPIRTNLGISIAPSNEQRTSVDINMGSPNPNNEIRIPQKEIWANIIDYYPDVPDVAIQKKGIVHDVPRNIMFEDPLDGAEFLFQQQSHIGNYYRRIRQQTNLSVINPHNIVRDGLFGHDIVQAGDPCLKRIRSVLATDYILPSNNSGYNSLHSMLFRLERGLRGKIEGRARGINWWEDTAQPHYLGGTINSTRLNIRVCRLDDRHQLIGI